MRRLFDFVVIIIVVVIAAAGGEVFVRRYVNHSGSSMVAKLLEPGSRVAMVPGHAWRSPLTLVLGLRLGCPYCEASMPFYRRLTQLERSGRLRAHITAVFPDTNQRLSRAVPDALHPGSPIAPPGVSGSSSADRPAPQVVN